MLRPGRSRASGRGGFALVELIVALTILAVVFLGFAGILPAMLQASSRAQVDFLTLNAVEDRMGLVLTDPRYGQLEDLYAELEDDIPWLPDGYLRITDIERTVDTLPSGRILDLTRVTVRVQGTQPPRIVERTVTVGVR
jgi:prepilin-type N-terminal cleavage/methylation domain-containing protein